MSKYQKTIIVDAIFFDGKNFGEIINWLEQFNMNCSCSRVWHDGKIFRIQTFENVRQVFQGEWILRFARGKFSSCSDDVFSAEYETVSVVTNTTIIFNCSYCGRKLDEAGYCPCEAEDKEYS